jgi:ATP-dependent RNA helicase DDX54/DBP10
LHQIIKETFKEMSQGNSSAGGGNGFKPLGLSDPVFRGVVRMGFRTPTPVQRKALPVVLSGADTVVMARTGSGKTIAFLIPLLETLLANTDAEHQREKGIRAVVLSPTRELSLQTLKVLTKLSHFTDFRAIGIHGGESIEQQFNALSNKPDVIVATPGRLAHHLEEIPDFNLKECQICILDEADRLLEMGFAMQLRQISKSLSQERCQKVLLSATMPKVLIEFTKGGFTTDPQVVRLNKEANVSEDLRVGFITCRSLEKDAVLLQILSTIEDDTKKHEGTRTGLTLVFCATRHHVEYVATLIQSSGKQATMIYGTLDSEARNSNMAAFRNGSKPILVVTDVAARGIDIPFMDHVIHYHFPPSPKLFVHRSGRAARAGRTGYCWSLVEPDELPYMVDLHLFLGRKLTSASGEFESGDKESIEPYTLDEMTPDMVHYGSVPESILTMEVENVNRIMKSEMAGSGNAEAMRAISKTCSNAMKQYRRTRPEASAQGSGRAKSILEGKKTETGERVGGTSIPPHPFLQGLVMEQYEEDKKNGKINTLNSMENSLKRQEFLAAMARFRPKETVFEAFATGGGRDAGVLSQVDKGRTTAASKKKDDSYALTAMKNMRRQLRMARDKGSTLVVAGSEVAMGRKEEEDAMEMKGNNTVSGDTIPNKPSKASEEQSIAVESKRRLSKAERRRLKKNPNAALPTSSNIEKKKTTVRDFRDPAFFIETDAESNPEEANRRRQVEAAMQPSAANLVKGSQGTAFRIEEAMLDIVGDENDQLVQKQRMMRWDKSKRKYIQTTVGAERSGDSKSKKLKLESGQIVKKDKLKLGDLYEKWQKRTSKSIGRDGVFDTPSNDDKGDYRSGAKGDHKRKGSNKKGGVMDEDKNDKQMSAQAIKMDRETKQDKRMKNMKKGDRQRLERDKKEEGDKGAPKRGSQGKRGNSGRWKK